MALLKLFLLTAILALFVGRAAARPVIFANAAMLPTLLVIFLASGEWPSLVGLLVPGAVTVAGTVLGLLMSSLLGRFAYDHSEANSADDFSPG